MNRNPVLEWLQKNNTLCEIINDIEAQSLTLEEKANLALVQISEKYQLPLEAGDVSEKSYEEHDALGIDPSSVHEQLAIAKYLWPEDDYRGLVLMALYIVRHKEYLHIDEAALKHFGQKDKIPNSYMVYFFGDVFDAELKFSLPDGCTNWTKSGAKYMQKVLHQNG